MDSFYSPSEQLKLDNTISKESFDDWKTRYEQSNPAIQTDYEYENAIANLLHSIADAPKNAQKFSLAIQKTFFVLKDNPYLLLNLYQKDPQTFSHFFKLGVDRSFLKNAIEWMEKLQIPQEKEGHREYNKIFELYQRELKLRLMRDRDNLSKSWDTQDIRGLIQKIKKNMNQDGNQRHNKEQIRNLVALYAKYADSREFVIDSEDSYLLHSLVLYFRKYPQQLSRLCQTNLIKTMQSYIATYPDLIAPLVELYQLEDSLTSMNQICERIILIEKYAHSVSDLLFAQTSRLYQSRLIDQLSQSIKKLEDLEAFFPHTQHAKTLFKGITKYVTNTQSLYNLDVFIPALLKNKRYDLIATMLTSIEPRFKWSESAKIKQAIFEDVLADMIDHQKSNEIITSSSYAIYQQLNGDCLEHYLARISEQPELMANILQKAENGNLLAKNIIKKLYSDLKIDIHQTTSVRNALLTFFNQNKDDFIGLFLIQFVTHLSEHSDLKNAYSSLLAQSIDLLYQKNRISPAILNHLVKNVILYCDLNQLIQSSHFLKMFELFSTNEAFIQELLQNKAIANQVAKTILSSDLPLTQSQLSFLSEYESLLSDEQLSLFDLPDSLSKKIALAFFLEKSERIPSLIAQVEVLADSNSMDFKKNYEIVIQLSKTILQKNYTDWTDVEKTVIKSVYNSPLFSSHCDLNTKELPTSLGVYEDLRIDSALALKIDRIYKNAGITMSAPKNTVLSAKKEVYCDRGLLSRSLTLMMQAAQQQDWKLVLEMLQSQSEIMLPHSRSLEPDENLNSLKIFQDTEVFNEALDHSYDPETGSVDRHNQVADIAILLSETGDSSELKIQTLCQHLKHIYNQEHLKNKECKKFVRALLKKVIAHQRDQLADILERESPTLSEKEKKQKINDYIENIKISDFDETHSPRTISLLEWAILYDDKIANIVMNPGYERITLDSNPSSRSASPETTQTDHTDSDQESIVSNDSVRSQSHFPNKKNHVKIVNKLWGKGIAGRSILEHFQAVNQTDMMIRTGIYALIKGKDFSRSDLKIMLFNEKIVKEIAMLLNRSADQSPDNHIQAIASFIQQCKKYPEYNKHLQKLLSCDRKEAIVNQSVLWHAYIKIDDPKKWDLSQITLQSSWSILEHCVNASPEILADKNFFQNIITYAPKSIVLAIAIKIQTSPDLAKICWTAPTLVKFLTDYQTLLDPNLHKPTQFDEDLIDQILPHLNASPTLKDQAFKMPPAFLKKMAEACYSKGDFDNSFIFYKKYYLVEYIESNTNQFVLDSRSMTLCFTRTLGQKQSDALFNPEALIESFGVMLGWMTSEKTRVITILEQKENWPVFKEMLLKNYADLQSATFLYTLSRLSLEKQQDYYQTLQKTLVDKFIERKRVTDLNPMEQQKDPSLFDVQLLVQSYAVQCADRGRLLIDRVLPSMINNSKLALTPEEKAWAILRCYDQCTNAEEKENFWKEFFNIISFNSNISGQSFDLEIFQSLLQILSTPLYSGLFFDFSDHLMRSKDVLQSVRDSDDPLLKQSYLNLLHVKIKNLSAESSPQNAEQLKLYEEQLIEAFDFLKLDIPLADNQKNYDYHAIVNNYAIFQSMHQALKSALSQSSDQSETEGVLKKSLQKLELSIRSYQACFKNLRNVEIDALSYTVSACPINMTADINEDEIEQIGLINQLINNSDITDLIAEKTQLDKGMPYSQLSKHKQMYERLSKQKNKSYLENQIYEYLQKVKDKETFDKSWAHFFDKGSFFMKVLCFITILPMFLVLGSEIRWSPAKKQQISDIRLILPAHLQDSRKYQNVLNRFDKNPNIALSSPMEEKTAPRQICPSSLLVGQAQQGLQEKNTKAHRNDSISN